MLFLLLGCSARNGADGYPPANVYEGATAIDPCENDVLAYQHDENFLENHMAMLKEAALATYTMDIETWPIHTRIIYSMLAPSGFHVFLETSIDDDGMGHISYTFGFQANETMLDPEYRYLISRSGGVLLIQDGDVWPRLPVGRLPYPISKRTKCAKRTLFPTFRRETARTISWRKKKVSISAVRKLDTSPTSRKLRTTEMIPFLCARKLLRSFSAACLETKVRYGHFVLLLMGQGSLPTGSRGLAIRFGESQILLPVGYV